MPRLRYPLTDSHVVGPKLRKIRVDARLTTDEVADRAGISAQWLRRIENQGHQPSQHVTEDLARALEVSIGMFTDPGPAPMSEEVA